MERKHTPVYGIKGKLISAVCMLLVAVIMVVSSTYAWFTLSTAPEVTGISTAIGANGALEIKLNGTVTGDTIDNISWGNLVDLGDAKYGLQAITLFPSTANFTDLGEGKVGLNGAAFLSYPKYGSDGRPGTTMGTTVSGIYNQDNFYMSEDTGVRGLGASSGLTDRQLAYRNALSEVSTAMSRAKNEAAASLNTRGDALGKIVIKKATNETVYTQAEINALKGIIEDLKGTKENEVDGILEFIEQAYLQQIVAFAASDETNDLVVDGAKISETVADSIYSTVKAKVASGDIDLQDIADTDKISVTVGEGESAKSYELSLTGTELLNGIEKFLVTKGNVTSASNALPTETKDSYDWDDISDVLNYLINVNYVEVNEMGVEEIRADMSKLVSSVMSLGGVTIEMKAGAGVYVEIADQCGNYNANVTLTNVTYGGLSLETMPVKMATASTVSTAYLAAAKSQVEAAGYPAAGSAAALLPLSEFYGYIIDLVFQTNAASSNLLLQVDAKDRIYKDNNNTETMGGGSYMTFASTSSDFTNVQVKELMKAIRIVFFDPTDNNTVLGYAKLDVDENSTIGADGVTAKMYMYESGFAGKAHTYKGASGKDVTDVYQVVTNTTVAYYENQNGTGTPVDATQVTGNDTDGYKLGETTVYKQETTTTKYYLVTNGVVSKEEATATRELTAADATTYKDFADVTLTDTTFEKKLTGDDAIIVEQVAQNTPVFVSTLVYLEGDTNKGGVDNGDVSATAAKSVTGSMNIQFSSSAELVPMEYGELHTPNQSTDNTGADTQD